MQSPTQMPLPGQVWRRGDKQTSYGFCRRLFHLDYTLHYTILLYSIIWRKIVYFQNGWGSGPRVGHLLTARVVVKSLADPLCMPKYPWVRYWSSSCSMHLNVNVRQKAFKRRTKKNSYERVNETCCIKCSEYQCWKSLYKNQATFLPNEI